MREPVESTSEYSTSRQHNGESGGGIVEKVRDAATTQLTNQKNRATDGLGSVAEAVRQTTQQLRDTRHDTLADYASQAADQIERLSQRLREREIGEMLDDVQRLARSQPALFIGGAFALGLIAARFLKSSSRPETEGPREWHGPSYAPSSAVAHDDGRAAGFESDAGRVSTAVTSPVGQPPRSGRARTDSAPRSGRTSMEGRDG